MTNFIPIFPLTIVIYPGEPVNLHIFEPRYKQLIRECAEQKKPFGIPVVIGGEVKEYGILTDLLLIEKTYDNGEMDIRVRGRRVFRILEIIRKVPEKLYTGAIVHYPQNYKKGNKELMDLIVQSVRQLHSLMEVAREFRKPDDELQSYDVGHDSGLSLEEEYEMLCLLHERQRQEYLKLHLGKVLPVMVEMERMKSLYKLNGHFRTPGTAEL